MNDRVAEFGRQLIAWYTRHGRHDLPWQQDPTLYRIWVSEIMLQQTQVPTVIPYFNRFTERFPDVESLGAADIDEVLHLWSGLGYYARARNLHAAACQICERPGRALPDDLEGWLELPGIGRSTAGAILALSAGRRFPILDGNVKRVLARYHAIEGWPGRAAVTRRLWELAEQHTPRRQVRAHTQAMMDLGATVCTRRRPLCRQCPVASGCLARRRGLESRLPSPRPRRKRPLRTAVVVLATREPSAVLLQRRPPAGIWGGLWSFPEFDDRQKALEWCSLNLKHDRAEVREWPVLRHSFTHFDLDLQPFLVPASSSVHEIREDDGWLWYRPGSPERVGLAAPVGQLIEKLRQRERTE